MAEERLAFKFSQPWSKYSPQDRPAHIPVAVAARLEEAGIGKPVRFSAKEVEEHRARRRGPARAMQLLQTLEERPEVLGRLEALLAEGPPEGKRPRKTRDLEPTVTK